jgi:hypothetical protein
MSRDARADILLILVVLVVGVIVGIRIHTLYATVLPDCTEDEWISPETGHCVHIDIIREGR